MRCMTSLIFLASVVLPGCLVQSDSTKSKPHKSISGREVKVPFEKCEKFMLGDEFSKHKCMSVFLGVFAGEKDTEDKTGYARLVDFMERTGISCEKAPDDKKPKDAEGIGFRLTLPENKDHDEDYQHIDIWCPSNIATVDIYLKRVSYKPPGMVINVISKPKDEGRYASKHHLRTNKDGVVIRHSVVNMNAAGQITGASEILFEKKEEK